MGTIKHRIDVLDILLGLAYFIVFNEQSQPN